MKIPLNKPIMAHDEELTELDIHEPTAKLARQLGLPYRFDENGIPYPVASITAKYIERLAKIPASSVDELSVFDFNNLTMLVTGFFISSAGTVEAEVTKETLKQPVSANKSTLPATSMS